MKPASKNLDFSNWNQKRFLLNGIAWILGISTVLPFIYLLGEGFTGITNGSINLGSDGFRQIKGTCTLLILSCLLGGVLGTTNGWLLSNCRFPGRKLLRLLQLIPLATPAYLLSATLIDLGSINGIRIHGMGWGVLIMAFTTYPYVFLLSTESFSKSGKKQLEACRILGVGPWASFFSIALPMALPAIGAGIALMGMEIINELGAVQLLNIPSISAGIVENWIVEENPSGAIGLALIALIIVLSLIAYERILRRKSRRWTEGIAGGESPSWKIKRSKAMIAQILSLIPPVFTLGTPLLWIIANVDQLGKGWDYELFLLTIRSLGLGLSASALTVFVALILSLAKRWNSKKSMKFINFVSGIGYGIPGAVLALGLLSFSGENIFFLSPLLLLSWGYCVRFLAIPKGGFDSAFERISPSIDEAASSLGCKWPGILKRIHLPLLKGPLAIGILLVFVDTIKELPLTFILRPFDFDTLSVRVFQYAGDERLAESIFPAVIILILGLIASFALIPNIDQQTSEVLKNQENQ